MHSLITHNTGGIRLESYPCCEINCCPSVQQECGHIDVAIVGSDMKGGESTLEEEWKTHKKGDRGQTSAFTSWNGTVNRDSQSLVFPSMQQLKNHRWTKTKLKANKLNKMSKDKIKVTICSTQTNNRKTPSEIPLSQFTSMRVIKHRKKRKRRPP